jgi:hypothetical protein
MDDPKIKALTEQALAEAQAGREAAMTPLPGPLKDVFAPCQNLKVGPWEIRPVYDADLETLLAWDHPFVKFLVSMLSGVEAKDYIPRGQDAWTLFWAFTHSPEELDAYAQQPDGKQKVEQLARKQFRHLTLPQCMKLSEAVMMQVGVLASTGIGYTEPTENEVREDPGSPAVPLTASAG